LEFTPDLFDTRQPSLSKKDLVGELKLAVEVGEINPEKIHKAIKRKPHPHYRVYFYDDFHVSKFCREMRGSTTDWVSGIECFMFSYDFLSSLVPHAKSSTSWTCTIVDDTLYLTMDEFAFSTVVEPLDMWQKFQESLATAAAEAK
jgi:uncharacterized protein YaeQ